MSKHTPGPWSIHNEKSIGASDGKQMIAHVTSPHIVLKWARSIDEINANARLIAAAPELLDMLVRMQVALGEFCCDNGISEVDMEESHVELLNVCNDADNLIKKVKAL